jgi:hypothetical protein
MKQLLKCLKCLAKRLINVGKVLITIPIACGRAAAALLAEKPEVVAAPAPKLEIVSPETVQVQDNSQNEIFDALWRQIQKDYEASCSPRRTWQQEILLSLPLPQLPASETPITVEVQRSLDTEVITKTPFPPCPDNLNDKKAWSVRKLQQFCRELNSIELSFNPSSQRLIEGHCRKNTNRRLIVKLIKEFYAVV